MEAWARPMALEDISDAQVLQWILLAGLHPLPQQNDTDPPALQRLLKYAAQGQAAIFQLSEAEAARLLRAAATGTDG
jgi:hypothetical protein